MSLPAYLVYAETRGELFLVKWSNLACAEDEKLASMPMFYVSLADLHTGRFIAVVLVNCLHPHAAAKAAGDIAVKSGQDLMCIEAAVIPVPMGAVIPAGFVGRLLSVADVETLDRACPGGDGVAMHLTHDDDSGILRADDGRTLDLRRKSTDTDSRPN